MKLADDNARRRIRTELDRTFLVEAAAGTGKTTELVHRIIAVLERGLAAVDSLVAVTFTEKAAGELKLRLRAGLEEARERSGAGTAARPHLEQALARLEEARVSTIHGFCAELLRERPVEAEVDPQFRILTEPEAERLYREAFSLWLQEQLEKPPPGIRRSLRRISFWNEAPTRRLEQAGWTLATWRDFRAPWRRDAFAREDRIDALVQRLHDFAALTERCSQPERDNFHKDTDRARRVSGAIRRAESVRARDYDGLEGELVDLARDRNAARPRKGYGGKYGDGLARAEVQAAHEELWSELRAFAGAADADLAALLQAELLGAVDRYVELKRRHGVLDFVDLLLLARDMIVQRDEVRADFQRRFKRIFVDEFQDTDPLQAEILLLLAANDPAVKDWRAVEPTPGKLFLVGDPKQSIYRFRRADVGIYLEVKELLQQRHDGDVCLHLTTSFRSVPSIQRAVNAAFAPLMNGDRAALQAEYVPLTEWRAGHASQPSIAALPVPRPYGWRNVTATAIEGSLPDAVGAFVEWLLHESGWTVTEREHPGEPVPVAARHVCLLFRRFDGMFAGNVSRNYVQALEARGIPHLLVGGRSFHEREEVETMRAALSAIEWPDDELSVFATLHGSLFAVGDAELLEYRHRFRRLHPFHLPEDLPERLQPIAAALGVIASLHRGRNHRSVAETIGLLLEATRAHAAFVLRPSGEQVLANVLHVAELARAYEGAGGLSFRGFVERLAEDAEGGKTAEAPIVEEGSDGVRLMTVHKAKGLEFPVVILADITARMARPPASRHIDPARNLCAVRIAGWSPAELIEHDEEELRREEAEAVRVAYVAATRARDLLVVPAVGDQKFDSGWVSPLNSVLYPERERWRRAAPAPGCPELGGDSVLARPVEQAFGADSVQPGLHAFDGFDVVWWDPAKLALDAQPRFGIRQEQLIGKDAPREIVEADVRRHREWETEREATLVAGRRPTLSAVTATQRARTGQGEGIEVELIELPRAAERPSGPRFGALVHAVLAAVPLDAARERIGQVARLQGRILGATAVEIESATSVTEATLRHPVLERARQAASRDLCRRETPILFRDADGAVVDGVVDLAFLEGDTWTVVDFKTDRELSHELAVYRRQVSLYAAGITAATGQKAVGVLLRV